MRLSQCSNMDDLRIAAKGRAHKMVFDYIDGGAGDEITLKSNSSAFDAFDLKFRVLSGVDDVDTSSEILGTKISVPFFTSPAAGNRLFHTQGERAVAKAVGDLGSIYCLSTLSSVSIEEIAKINPGPKWFQLYVWKDRVLVKEMLQRAKDAGYRALILTVDFPITGKRERDAKNGFTIPPTVGLKQVYEGIKRPFWSLDYAFGSPIKYANLSADTPAVSLAQFVEDQLHAGFCWKDAEWLLGEWNGPAVIKGIVRDDDARRAVDLGFNAIMISNHGGRQLDRSPAPIDALQPIAQAVGSDVELIVDGGIRRGVDVLTALSLGAKSVSFARPYLYGLAAAGERGVKRALDILAEEVRRDMALMGVTTTQQIDNSFVERRRSKIA